MNDKEFYMGDVFTRSAIDTPYCTVSSANSNIKFDTGVNTLNYIVSDNFDILETRVKELEEKIAAVLPKQIGYRRGFRIDSWNYEVL